jgi:hypothetical protein
MPRTITVLENIKSLDKQTLKKLALELFYLEEKGVYPKDSLVCALAREIAKELDGIHLNHAQDMVNSQVLRVIARNYLREP